MTSNRFPLLNIYVYSPYTSENAEKPPHVYYFPQDIDDKDVKILSGYENGAQIVADAIVDPPKDDRAIFVVGINERVIPVKSKELNKSAIAIYGHCAFLGSAIGYDFYLSNMYNCSVGEVKEDNYTDPRAMMSGISPQNLRLIIPFAGAMPKWYFKLIDDKYFPNGYRVVYSRFSSMSAMKKYEPWGMGDAEVAFLPLDVRDSYVLWKPVRIKGGYRRATWWGERFSKDNDNITPYFIPFNYDNNPQIAYHYAKEGRGDYPSSRDLHSRIRQSGSYKHDDRAWYRNV